VPPAAAVAGVKLTSASQFLHRRLHSPFPQATFSSQFRSTHFSFTAAICFVGYSEKYDQ
jgi:hypothetical protein